MWQSFYLAWEALSWIKGPPGPGQHPVPTMGSPSLAGRPGKGGRDNCGIPSPRGRLVPLLAAPHTPGAPHGAVYGPRKRVYSVH